jgi:hypothetical protein
MFDYMWFKNLQNFGFIIGIISLISKQHERRDPPQSQLLLTAFIWGGKETPRHWGGKHWEPISKTCKTYWVLWVCIKTIQNPGTLFVHPKMQKKIMFIPSDMLPVLTHPHSV